MPPVKTLDQAADLTEQQKIEKLAGWSLKYRKGLKELIEAGADPDELDELVEEAEKKLDADQKAKANQQRKSKIRRRF